MKTHRQGTIHFSDASLHINEDGLGECKTYEDREAWQKRFKHEVFKRIVQQLNRLGWRCQVPLNMVQDYSRSFACQFRECQKGDLRGELKVCGRHIAFEMWQGVNTPTRPDHGGRYESQKEAVMPYLLRLEMERTRRRLRTYLCNVLSGYTYEESRSTLSYQANPCSLTAMDRLARHYTKSSHFKGDLSTYTIASCNRRSADGKLLEHGQRVWGFNRKGRAFTGITYYNTGNMWCVVTGQYDLRYECCSGLHTTPPKNLRVKRNQNLRRMRLEQELARSIEQMDFHRAQVLRDLIWPPKTELFLIWNREHDLFHKPNFQGYTKDRLYAGKFTREEIGAYNSSPNEAIPMTAGQNS